MRNKKLITLQSINHNLHYSLENSRNLRHKSNDQKNQNSLLEKLVDKPIVRPF